ncbi:hypothetical protein J2755_001962 [Methanohalophilus levihalophilus]|uniref:DUF5611 family protein n=1 Tax=Methanohalophilus levihalophilus TaxID=1431282 RepID=UPI00315A4D81|nr:hypothetical protein [Methanohalophilus levihalophilus]
MSKKSSPVQLHVRKLILHTFMLTGTFIDSKYHVRSVIMQEYKLKRGNSPDIERIYEELQASFPSEIVRDGDKLTTSYGAMSELSVWMNGKLLVVDTVSNTEGLDDDAILDTNKHFRDFLFKATGYTAKERLKQAKKAVSK